MRGRLPFVVAGLLAVAARLPYLTAPLDSDEGGYAYVARQWASGQELYNSVWVDRPQGLVLAYRFWTSISGSRVWIHVGAIVLALLLTAAVAAAAWALGGRRAAIAAAFLVAVVGAAPRFQGFELNGELLAAPFSAGAVAAALWARRSSGRHELGLFLAAGLSAAIALSMKQSGLDGLVVVAVVAGAVSVSTRRWRPVAAAGLGVALPVLAMLAHAALTSWSNWWYAVVEYRLEVSDRFGWSGRWDNLVVAFHAAGIELVVMAAMATVGVVWSVVHRRAEPVVWLVAATAGVLGGVYFFPHYWMQLVGPCCLLAALALAEAPVRLAVSAAALACVPVLVFTGRVVSADARERAALAMPYQGALSTRDVAAWLRAHARPGDEVWAHPGMAGLYHQAGLRTDFPYLWYSNVSTVPGAIPRLATYVYGPHRPTWLVLWTWSPPGSGLNWADVNAFYRPVVVVDGVVIMRAIG